jgi:dipeptidyl aminopeptidase/acylaminoacyl peptidase
LISASVAGKPWATAFAVILGLLICASLGFGCKKAAGPPKIGGLGRPLVLGGALDLRLTPDARFATYLAEADKPRLEGVPAQMVIGALNAIPLDGGAPRRIGIGVTNVPGGYLFSPDSRWVLFLAGYNPASQTGQLYALDLRQAGSRPELLGGPVSYMLVSPDSQWVAFVDSGTLKVGLLPGGPFKQLSGEVSTAEFTPDSRFIVYKRKLSAGSTLFTVRVGQWNPKKIGDQVGDYSVSSNSKQLAFTRRDDSGKATYALYVSALSEENQRPAKISSAVGIFSFSPDGRWLAKTDGWKLDELRGDLSIGSADGSGARKVGEMVGERLSFAPDSTAVGYLERWDQTARAGTMGLTELPSGKPRRLGGRVPNFAWGADGKALAFISRFIQPVYSVDLMLYRAGEEKAGKLAQGVFGYGFGPRNEYLLFRTNCIREGRACDLHQLDLRGAKGEPRKILEGIYSFKSAERGDRLLVSYTRIRSETYDIAVYNLKTGERKTLEQQVQLPALFATEDGSKVVYIVAQPERAGVYLADQVP